MAEKAEKVDKFANLGPPGLARRFAASPIEACASPLRQPKIEAAKTALVEAEAKVKTPRAKRAFDKTAYQREYMRKKRAAKGAEK